MQIDTPAKQGFSITPAEVKALLDGAFKKLGYGTDVEIDLRDFTGYWEFQGGDMFDVHTDAQSRISIGDLRWDIYCLSRDMEEEISDASFVIRALSMILYAISISSGK